MTMIDLRILVILGRPLDIRGLIGIERCPTKRAKVIPKSAIVVPVIVTVIPGTAGPYPGTHIPSWITVAPVGLGN